MTLNLQEDEEALQRMVDAGPLDQPLSQKPPGPSFLVHGIRISALLHVGQGCTGLRLWAWLILEHGSYT